MERVNEKTYIDWAASLLGIFKAISLISTVVERQMTEPA